MKREHLSRAPQPEGHGSCRPSSHTHTHTHVPPPAAGRPWAWSLALLRDRSVVSDPVHGQWWWCVSQR